MSRPIKNLVLLAFLGSTLVLTACGSRKPGDEKVHREGQPDMVRVPDDDAEMNAAVAKARETADTFLAALKAPTAQQNSFSVKKPFQDDKQVEHIWLSDVSLEGDHFRGRVDNEPVDVKNVKIGETAVVAKNELSDWFYVDGGKLVGGYTLRVLYRRMSADEKKDFDSHVGFKID